MRGKATSEQIICNIIRPEVGVCYIAESPEAADEDRLAACYLAVDSTMKEIRRLSQELGVAYPAIVDAAINAELWQHGK